MAIEEPLPQRTFTDPQTLKALAHPLRLRLLEALAFHGPATATELAEHVDESPSNCSWHLRQLAKYDFVEGSPPAGQGGKRAWRLIPWHTRMAEIEDNDIEFARAEDAVEDVLLNRQFEALSEWRTRRRQEPAEWRDAGFSSQAIFWLTAAEAAELRDELAEVFERTLARAVDRYRDETARPEGSRPVQLMSWAVPGPVSAETPPTPKATGHDE